MNPWIGWALAAAALFAGWRGYGWPGIAFAASAIVFWLLLQISRSLRVMRMAGESPVGHVDSAVMLHAKLRAGLPMLEVVKLTRSLGRRIGETPEVWTWSDEGGSRVAITFVGGRCTTWSLERPPDAPLDGTDPPAQPATALAASPAPTASPAAAPAPPA